MICAVSGICYFAAPVHRTDVGLLYGSAARVKLFPLAVRAEYERIQQSAGNPNLLARGDTCALG